MLGVAPVLGLRCLLVLAMLGWKRIHTMVRASRRRTLFLICYFFSLSLHILVLPGELIRLRQGKRRQRDRGVMGMCIEIKIVTFSEEEEGKKKKN